MTMGEHAADDGSFARSAGVHAGRAGVLIAVALVLGFLVLDQNSAPVRVDTSGPDVTQPEVTVPESPATTAAPVTTTAALRPPEQVKVVALNATGTSGVAGKISDQLRAASYNVLAPGNATSTARAAAKTSLVYYTAGFTREAVVVAQSLGLPATNVQVLPNPPPAPDSVLRGANIVVLVKEDLANRPAPTTSTTAKRP